MMNGKHVLDDLITLLKVFDVNFINDEDCEKLSGLDMSQAQGVNEAVQRLLLPEFYGYTEAARTRILRSLKDSVNDPREDFGRLFDTIEPAFDTPVKDKKLFMKHLLHALEP